MTTEHAKYSQVGQYAHIEYDGTASGNATSTVQFDVSSLFSGATIDTAVWSGTTRQAAGSATYVGGTNNYNVGATYTGT
ncbi:hypothetical protein IAI36_11690, partial [Streptococcus pseudopneumoniae]|uniref:hypothetical protein n=1 Tax=Streptococcus pseudopneumoniae TaxID=257758 RepID=UPI0018B01AAC